MRQLKYLVFILLVLCLSASAKGQNKEILQKAHMTTHKIEMEAITGGSGHCSATAIGPHALLTAAHCIEPSQILTVDGKAQTIYEFYGDGLDHVIYLLRGDEFKDYANVDLRGVTQGDDVFMFGNPASVNDLFRKGYVESVEKPFSGVNKNVTLLRMSLDVFFGDSGSGVFNEKGDVVTVLHGAKTISEDDMVLKVATLFEFGFDAEQIERARNFKAPVISLLDAEVK